LPKSSAFSGYLRRDRRWWASSKSACHIVHPLPWQQRSRSFTFSAHVTWPFHIHSASI